MFWDTALDLLLRVTVGPCPGKMARSSSALPVVLLALAALFVAPAFVPSPAPRASREASAAAVTAGALLPVLTAQSAMAED